MAEVLYPISYGDHSELVTMDELERRRLGAYCEPETKRRIKAWLIYKNGLIGIGSSGPRANPSDVSPASQRGMSFHQNQEFDDGTVWFMAFDLVVGVEGGANRSPTWDEVADADLFGLHAFIGENTDRTSDDEPWHLQPYEVRGYASWHAAGRKRPIPGFTFPPEIPPVVPPVTPPVPPPVRPTPTEAIMSELPTLRQGATGQDVRTVQGLLNTRINAGLQVDGHFGPRTDNQVRRFQNSANITVDGVVGTRETWPALLLVST